MTVKVKICGITSAADARQAIAAGADALGLVFYPPSPRYVSIDTAAAIARAAGPFQPLVGLFVNASVEDITAVLAAVPLSLLQFHGDETPDFCDSIGRPYLKVIRVRPDTNVQEEIQRFPNALGFLLDTWNAEKYGGTGAAFDWQLIPKGIERPIILAGGLNPTNVTAAIKAVTPYGIDVSGGVEAEPGKKSAQLMEQFINNAKQL